MQGRRAVVVARSVGVLGPRDAHVEDVDHALEEELGAEELAHLDGAVGVDHAAAAEGLLLHGVVELRPLDDVELVRLDEAGDELLRERRGLELDAEVRHHDRRLRAVAARRDGNARPGRS